MTSANILTRLTGFLYRIFLSRRIGAEGLGLFALIMPVYSVCCAVVASGLPVAAMKKISEAHTPEEKKGLTHAALKSVLLISAVLFALLLILARPISSLLGDERTYPSLLILTFAVLITGFENIYKSSFYSDRAVKVPALTEIAEQVFRTVAVVILITFISKGNSEKSAAVLTLGIFLGELLSLFVLSSSYRRYTRKTEPRHFGIGSSGIIGIAFPVTAAKTAESFLSSLSNILIPYLLIMSGISRSQATGMLGVISGMIMPLLYMPCVFTNALAVNLVPFISENLERKKQGAVIRKCEKALFVTSLFSFPCTFFMIAFRGFISEVLFSDPRVAQYLPIMAVGGLAAIFRHILSSIMNACGREKTASAYSFSGNIAELAIMLILTPRFGIFGYIASYALSSVLMLIPCFFTVMKSLNLSVGSVLHTLTPIFPALISSYASSILLSNIISSFGMVISTLFSGFFGVFLYLTTVYITILKKKIIFFSKIT